MWDVVGQKSDATNAPFHFLVRCGKDGDECKGGSLAVTDSTAEKEGEVRVILICPLFFQAVETQKNLDSKEIIKNLKRNQNSWCQPGHPFKDFETAGHTLLHEMTHLDAVGAAAGFSVRGNTHGTNDLVGNKAYQPAAIGLKKLWDSGKQAPGALTPVENAENLAGAATEWYFLQNCGFTEITF